MQRLGTQGRPRDRRRRGLRLACEGLEGRLLLANFLVTNTAASGQGSLQQAIIDLDSTGGTTGFPANTIDFNIPGPGVHTIEPPLPLPLITKPVLIDGRSQGGPGYMGAPLIELSGVKNVDAHGPGLQVEGGQSTVQGLDIHDFLDAQILLEGAGGDLVQGNYLGTDPTGTKRGGGTASGVVIDGTSNNTIGGTTASARNLISGNADDGVGVLGLSARGTVGFDNLIEGNFIGTNVNGTAALSNNVGIGVFTRASRNTIGGTAAGAGNVISGNVASGVGISQTGTTGNLVLGNLVGTSVNGVAALPNLVGIDLFSGATGNTIGGTTSKARNVISGNSGAGVDLTSAGTTGNLVEGNLVGTDIGGNTPLPNGKGSDGSGINLFGGASGNTIGGATAGAGNVISGNAAEGLKVLGSGTSGNLVEGNLIGTNISGNAAVPNGTDGSFQDGIAIFNGASGNTIGGTASGARNVISGNPHDGISLSVAGTTGNLVLGNFIGTNITGIAALPNLVGIAIYAGATGNTIGGAAPGARNVISGNTRDGVDIIDPGTTGNLAQGNFVGTNVSGTAALPNFVGVSVFSGASGNTIGGRAAGAGNLISGNSNGGVNLANAGTSANLIQGNLIGSDVSGTAALGNHFGIGIFGGASGNTIGGHVSGAGDVISGNLANGVFLQDLGTTGNLVQGNLIGTNSAATAALPNGKGKGYPGVVLASGASGNAIGGTTQGAGNVIAGNGGDGVEISGIGTSGNRVQGNFIGTNASGSRSLGNLGDGVFVLGASGNTIGGNASGAGNVIAFNRGDGVHVASGDQISILSNSIFSNQGPGIKLDPGANDNARSPVLRFVAKAGGGTVIGKLTGRPSATYQIQVFMGPGAAQGSVLLGSLETTANSRGIAVFVMPIDMVIPPRMVITATATDSIGNTSAFSAPVRP